MSRHTLAWQVNSSALRLNYIKLHLPSNFKRWPLAIGLVLWKCGPLGERWKIAILSSYKDVNLIFTAISIFTSQILNDSLLDSCTFMYLCSSLTQDRTESVLYMSSHHTVLHYAIFGMYNAIDLINTSAPTTE